MERRVRSRATTLHLRDGSRLSVREPAERLRPLLGSPGVVGVTTPDGPRWLALADVVRVDASPPPGGMRAAA